MEVAELSRTKLQEHDKCKECQELCTMTVLRVFGGNFEEGLLRRSLELFLGYCGGESCCVRLE